MASRWRLRAAPSVPPWVRLVAPFASVAVLGVAVLVVPERERARPLAASAQAGLRGGDRLTTKTTGAAPVTPPLADASEAVPDLDFSAFSPPPVGTTTTTTVQPRPRPEPLRIAAFGWSTARGAGTGVGTAGVPAGSLPVGAVADSPDKISWFRLTGSGTVLELHPVDDPAANRFADTATIKLCVSIDKFWAPGPNQAPPAAPGYDAARCADGTLTGDGSWLFSLQYLDPIDNPRGAVLVPGPGTFQVAFAQPG